MKPYQLLSWLDTHIQLRDGKTNIQTKNGRGKRESQISDNEDGNESNFQEDQDDIDDDYTNVSMNPSTVTTVEQPCQKSKTKKALKRKKKAKWRG